MNEQKTKFKPDENHGFSLPPSKMKKTEIGKIPEDWEVRVVDDFVKIKHGFAFKGDSFTEQENNQIVLTPGNVHIGGGFKPNKFKFTTQQYPKEYILNEGDILVTMTDLSKKGDTLGYAAKIPKSDTKKYLHNQRLGLLQFWNNEIHKDFLYWVLRTKKYNHFVVGSATGSTVKHTSPTRIINYKFAFPPLKEQTSIAKILSDLDSKIELLQRQNKTLEAIAQAIFKHWFVDFEFPNEEGKPYKSSGGEMVFNEELGKIPREWSVESIDKAVNFLNGLALQKYPPMGEEYLPVIKIREMRQGITNNTDKASPDILEEYIVHEGDVLFSWSGSLDVCIWGYGKGALNQHLFKVTSEKYPKWFYYYWVKYYLPNFRHIAAGKATTMGHIKRHHLSESFITIPNEPTFNKMNDILDPFIEKIIQIKVENRKLSDIRDIILPKLMSGEIRVPINKEAGEIKC